jgi:S1-C subfamily serine protease
VTAAHVVANAEAIMVQFFDGESIQATTLRISRAADVAVIKLAKSPSHAKIAQIGDSQEARIGEEIFVIGAPMGLPYSLSRGVISGRHLEENHVIDGAIMEFFQTDAAINTGNSGGPMFNSQGEVIGIVSSILTRSGGFEGIGFAATSNVAKSLLRARSSIYFGTESTILPYEFARILNVPQESGLLVEHVVQESPAGKIGLRGGFRKVTIEDQEILLGGDIILSVDEVQITGMDSFYELMKYMDSIQDTHTYHLRVLRAGEIRDFHWVNADF